jgi:hypothetical protein
MKMDLKEIEQKGVDWINFAQDGDQWQTLMSAIKNCQVRIGREFFSLAERLFVFQEGFWSMELVGMSHL